MADYYRLGQGEPRKRRRKLIWLIVLIIIVLFSVWAFFFVRAQLKPKVTIKQSKAVTTKVDYDKKTKHYDEENFGVDLPADWQQKPRPEGPYRTYTWAISDSGTNGQQIEIFEDTIPVNFAVNRALIVEGQVDHVELNGDASDNCITFTRDTGSQAGQFGTPAKWQDVSFLCDRSNQQRDVIGTSSTDGVNIVQLKNSSTGVMHKFLFTYTDHSINPDYSVFYTVIRSFRMK